MTALARDANVLGALSLVVADRTSDAIAAAAGQSATAAAALSALHHFLDRPTIDRLRQVLGLTPSGTVRLVDRLVEAGYVTRGPGGDGRSRSVTLTAEGATLEALLGRVLAAFVRGPGATRWICRLCDTGACGRAEGLCPAARASAARR
jgi:DNA-binding MarR family transcriptional regulator